MLSQQSLQSIFTNSVWTQEGTWGTTGEPIGLIFCLRTFELPAWAYLHIGEALTEHSMNYLPQQSERTAQTGAWGDNQGHFLNQGKELPPSSWKCLQSKSVYSFQLRSQLKNQPAAETLHRLSQRRLLFRQTCCSFFGVTAHTAPRKEAGGLLHAEVLQSYLKECCFSGYPCKLRSDTSPRRCLLDFSPEERLAGDLRFRAVPL